MLKLYILFELIFIFVKSLSSINLQSKSVSSITENNNL
jgi:hypothetical protein